MGRPEAPVCVYDVVQELAEPADWIIDRFGIDALDLGRTFTTAPEHWLPTRLGNSVDAFCPASLSPGPAEDGALAARKRGEVLARKPTGATFFDQTVFPYVDGYPGDRSDLSAQMDRVLWGAFVHAPQDRAGDPDFWERLRKNTLDLRRQTDQTLVVVIGCNLFEWGTFLRRINNFLIDLYTDPEAVAGLLDRLLEIHLGTLEKVCAAVGDAADDIRFADDLGMDSGPLMSEEHYRRPFLPVHRTLTAYVRQHSSMIPYLHSCGSIYKPIPGLIDAGFEILNPMQTNCADMEPERLKREFGADVTFWGSGIDTQTTLNNGTPTEAKDEVKSRLEILAPGGGCVFNTVHNILPDVPPANIIAMFKAVHEFFE